MTFHYPGYDVLARWDSPSFDAATRRVLAQRQHAIPPRRFLTAEEWELLEAVIARLLPQPERDDPIPITPWIDAQLHDDISEGFRHPTMPHQRTAWRQGLAALEGEAQHRHASAFTTLSPQEQDALLDQITNGHAQAPQWQGLPAEHFLIQVVLKTAVGIYYSHPTAWNEIGFGGPASPRGYVRMGFNERDAWEAREVR